MNITDRIAEFAKTRPNDLALLTLTERLVWSDLNNKINLTAAFLTSHGVGAGHRVGISLRDQFLHLLVSLALARLGVAQIALPPTDPGPVRAKLASRLNIFAVIEEDHADGLEGIRSILLARDRIDSVAIAEDQTQACLGDEPFLILQSSGTTGDPKFSELSHQMGVDRFQRYLTYFG
ncbi:AMP-binding protein, partial [Yoonia sp.]|nr:AMP-binding protein [Yoonia sp.]